MLTWEQEQIQGAPAIVQKLAVSARRARCRSHRAGRWRTARDGGPDDDSWGAGSVLGRQRAGCSASSRCEGSATAFARPHWPPPLWPRVSASCAEPCGLRGRQFCVARVCRLPACLLASARGQLPSMANCRRHRPHRGATSPPPRPRTTLTPGPPVHKGRAPRRDARRAAGERDGRVDSRPRHGSAHRRRRTERAPVLTNVPRE